MQSWMWYENKRCKLKKKTWRVCKLVCLRKKSLWQMSLGCFIIFRRCFGYAWKKKKNQSSRFHTHSGKFQFFQFPIPPTPPPSPPPPSKMNLEAKPTCLVVRKRSRSSKDWFSHISLALFRIQRTLGSHTVINDYSLPLWPAHYEQTSELPKINSSLLTLNCSLRY